MIIEDLLEMVPNWWKPLLEEWLNRLVEEWYNINNITYIKEKYWMLRIEATPWHDILSEIENTSWWICDECWAIWRTRYDIFWYRTLCDKHYNLIKEKWQKNNY
jgi:hypothetical protein